MCQCLCKKCVFLPRINFWLSLPTILGSSFALIFFKLTILAYGQLENLSVLRLVLVGVRVFFFFFLSWNKERLMMKDSFSFSLDGGERCRTFSLKFLSIVLNNFKSGHIVFLFWLCLFKRKLVYLDVTTVFFFLRSRYFPCFLTIQLRQAMTLKLYVFLIVHNDMFDFFIFRTNAVFSGKCRKRLSVFPNP